MVEVPAQLLGPGDVRLRVRAATVNPTDTMLRAGDYLQYYPDDPLPWVPGMDVAGEVTEVGERVSHLRVGELAMGVVAPHGAYREDIVLPGDSVVPAPQGVGAAAAATVPMNGMTAWAALRALALQPGQVLGVTGAAGCFGGYVVQLAKAAGLTVVADASPSDEELVRGLGADIVVQRGDDVARRMREQVPDGVDGLADGAVQGQLTLGAVKDGGGIATVRNYVGPDERGLRYFPILVGDVAEEREALDGLRRQVEAGVLTPRVARTFPAEEAAQAHRMLEGGGVRGRIVLRF
ncbi:NADP-dependent oxidoreductase [Nocardioides alkalitolerans]|uniref:NADP-dependent oxidoreductase n=1 Tax=Nocardioides alkalitolerans TaxID=281714 RepID=UPI001B7F9562|nr:NADP-dependent oxidoreductase [Nocardioides alkalitolerans]